MEYNFREIEKRWQIFWKKKNIFQTKNSLKKNLSSKFYILNMFPYPSGYGLHVGHCLGYIASDIYARYKRTEGCNVLYPMGFDSFGLPAEQYAIQTGKNPDETTRDNIKRYKNQMEKIGLSFDWKNQLCTSSTDYYRWTQWMFIQIFDSWYDKNSDKAKPINLLIEEFNKNGNLCVNPSSSNNKITNFKFNSQMWKEFNSYKKESILSNYRLAFLCKNTVNWCPELGTVLANDEIKNGKSQRGGFPIYKKKMLQWHIRISSYAERLLKGLDDIECSESLKKIQYNWIGKKSGISIYLDLFFHINGIKKIEIFLERPEIIFGMTFIILSTDHPFSEKISLLYQKEKVKSFCEQSSLIEKEKSISGIFTGNYIFHPFIKNKKIPIYISDNFYVDNQTRSTIGIPGHENICQTFAKKFHLDIIDVLTTNNNEKKEKTFINSYFLNGLNIKEARKKIILILEKKKIGFQKNSYKLRDAIFSRQRYWGEPIPIYYKRNHIPNPIPIENLPLILPKINNYHPKNGKSPLVRVNNWAWDEKNKKIVSNTLIDNQSIFPIETNTMPSWAGSSWYFLRYMDVNNSHFFLSKRKEKYWINVDLYIGGSEHSTGHLIYARFWNKFLKDRGWIKSEEPFQRILNQGMILSYSVSILKIIGKNIFVSFGLRNNRKKFHDSFQEVYVDISLIDHNNELNINKFKKWRSEYYHAEFVLEKGVFLCKKKLEKMSKSKYNVITPDTIYKKFGSDVFRVYEMFLGPIMVSKPWNDEKINGIKNFLNKLWRLFHNNNNQTFYISNNTPTFKELKILHFTIKKLKEKINSFSFNTSISYLMIMVNKLIILKCNKRKILEPLVQLLAPFTPHISEEIWMKLGKKKSILFYSFPNFDQKYLLENKITYPIMLNGKFKFTETFEVSLKKKEIEKKILNHIKVKIFLKEKKLKKIIIIQNKIINIIGK